jgi:SH3 domain-containing YSC84-like protein 1
MGTTHVRDQPDGMELIRTDKVLEERNFLRAHTGRKRFEMRLRNRAKYLTLASVVLILASMTWAADDDKDQPDINKRIVKSAEVLNEIMATPDKAIPDKVMDHAKCIAVIPSVIKVAFVVGGQHGKGVATCRTAKGWSAPAPITITGGSWGLQLGGQAIDLVMVVTNDQGMQHLLSSKFKLGADASAAAGPVGRQTAADTDISMRAEVLTYSRARGVFAGIDLTGAVVNQDKDETTLLYGKPIAFADILGGKVTPPPASEAFLAAVKKYSTQAREQGKVDTEPTDTASANTQRQ